MITTIITIVAVILFMFFMCIMSLGVIEDIPVLVFGGIILALLLYVGIAAYPQSDMLTEPVVTKPIAESFQSLDCEDECVFLCRNLHRT